MLVVAESLVSYELPIQQRSVLKISYMSRCTVPSSTAESVHIIKMCQAFVDIGHEVDLFAYRGPGTHDDLCRYYGVKGGFSIVPIGGPNVAMAKRLWRAFVAARAARNSSESDIFFGRDLYSLLSATRAGKPIVFEAHTPPTNGLDRRLISSLLSNKSTSHMVVISTALKNEYSRLYPNREGLNFVVAHDGADLQPSEAATSIPLGGRAETLQLGYVGHLYAGKGADVVFRLAKAMPEFDFHIIGGNADSVSQAKRDWPLSNLFFHGHVQHALVHDMLSSVDIALFPCQKSVLSKGGNQIADWMSPLKVFEYMAAAKPIICSDLPVIREVLTDQVNSVLVSADDLSEWKAAILNLDRNRELMSRIGQRAQADLETHYTWRTRAERVLEPIIHST